MALNLRHEGTFHGHGGTFYTYQQGRLVELTMREIEVATLQEAAKEVRKALPGRGSYTTEWPSRRRRRGQAARMGKSSRVLWHVKVQQPRRGDTRNAALIIRNKADHSGLLERSDTIRGHRNRHRGSAQATIKRNWDLISTLAMQRAHRRAQANARTAAIRHQKGMEARIRGQYAQLYTGGSK